MPPDVLAEIAIGALFGLFFVVIGILQLATKTLYTGGRGRGFRMEKNSPLVWVFAPLEILVGLAALGLTAFLAYRAALLDGSCDERAQKHVCVEYRGGDVGECGGTVHDHGCAKDNLLGHCTTHTKDEVEKTYYYYSDMWTETAQQRAAECAKMNGEWHKFGK